MSYSASDTARLNKYYTDALTQHGLGSAKSLNWIDEGRQRVRFEVLSQIADLTSSSILDVGCGLGDLYGFLKTKYPHFTYTGIDIVPEMIEDAKKKYPEASFYVADFSELDTLQERNIKQGKNAPGAYFFDYILASGAFSYFVENAEKIYFSAIRDLFFMCKRGLACNFLDRDRRPIDSDFYTYTMDEVLAFCKTLSPWYTLRHDYLDYDFTVYVYK